ncbi:MAG TPA: hypothetical protein VL002_11570, partial [Candidimonas sp.]|nr:hypothetical protein [Candidimonas sp.]
MPSPYRQTRSAPKHSVGYWLRTALLLLMLLAMMAFAPVYAAGPDTKIDVDKVLDTARTQIDTVQTKLTALPKEPLDDTQLADLRAKALDAQTQADAAKNAIDPQLT